MVLSNISYGYLLSERSGVLVGGNGHTGAVVILALLAPTCTTGGGHGEAAARCAEAQVPR